MFREILLDIDETLFKESSEISTILNVNLLRALKLLGVKRINFFTKMSLRPLGQSIVDRSDDLTGLQMMTRAKLEQALIDEGFEVSHVVTPADRFIRLEGDKIPVRKAGAAYHYWYRECYKRIVQGNIRNAHGLPEENLTPEQNERFRIAVTIQKGPEGLFNNYLQTSMQGIQRVRKSNFSTPEGEKYFGALEKSMNTLDMDTCQQLIDGWEAENNIMLNDDERFWFMAYLQWERASQLAGKADAECGYDGVKGVMTELYDTEQPVDFLALLDDSKTELATVEKAFKKIKQQRAGFTGVVVPVKMYSNPDSPGDSVAYYLLKFVSFEKPLDELSRKAFIEYLKQAGNDHLRPYPKRLVCQMLLPVVQSLEEFLQKNTLPEAVLSHYVTLYQRLIRMGTAEIDDFKVVSEAMSSIQKTFASIQAELEKISYQDGANSLINAANCLQSDAVATIISRSGLLTYCYEPLSTQKLAKKEITVATVEKMIKTFKKKLPWRRSSGQSQAVKDLDDCYNSMLAAHSKVKTERITFQEQLQLLEIMYKADEIYDDATQQAFDVVLQQYSLTLVNPDVIRALIKSQLFSKQNVQALEIACAPYLGIRKFNVLGPVRQKMLMLLSDSETLTQHALEYILSLDEEKYKLVHVAEGLDTLLKNSDIKLSLFNLQALVDAGFTEQEDADFARLGLGRMQEYWQANRDFKYPKPISFQWVFDSMCQNAKGGLARLFAIEAKIFPTASAIQEKDVYALEALYANEIDHRYNYLLLTRFGIDVQRARAIAKRMSLLDTDTISVLERLNDSAVIRLNQFSPTQLETHFKIIYSAIHDSTQAFDFDAVRQQLQAIDDGYLSARETVESLKQKVQSAKQLEGEGLSYLTQHATFGTQQEIIRLRHEDPVLQHEYDKRFGLTVPKSPSK